MNLNELRSLQEAYLEVVEGQQLDEAMRPGKRQRKVAAKVHDPYASSRTRAIAHNVAVRNDGPGTPGYEKKSTGGKGARFAGYGDRGAGNKARRRMGQEPLRGNTRKEEVDIYDIILSHLIDEGYADTVESAVGIMVNMSEDWRDSIVDETINEGRRTSLSALSRESQQRKADKERGRPETQDEIDRRLARGRYAPSQYKWEKVDGRWKNMGRKDGEKD